MGDLTEREEEVIELIAKGLSTRSIAERLWITINTARNHIQRILEKLEVSNRIQAVVAWRNLQQDPSERILAYCRRSRIVLTDTQVELLRGVFRAREVNCEGIEHVFPEGQQHCLCGRIRVS